MNFEDYDGFDDFDALHELEIGYSRGYCPECLITVLFRSVSYPGGRSHKPLACVECGKEIGGSTEDDASFIGKMDGDVGEQIFDLIAKEDLEQAASPQEAPKMTIPEGLSIEECPSLVFDEYWVHAERKFGTYPSPTVRGGKWLLFIPADQINEVWATVKKAVEDGRLGGRAKSSTALSNPNSNDPTKNVICVYTYDGDDKDDVWRVRGVLRDMGFVRKIYWKADQTTRDGQYNNRGHRGVSRYGG